MLTAEDVTVEQLAAMLYLTLEELEVIVNEQEKHYSVSSIESGGRRRRILLPLTRYDNTLKCLLDLMAVTTNYRTPEFVFGFVKGSSTRHNAKHHLGKPCVLRLDIHRFFDSISRVQVENALLSHGYRDDVSQIISLLATPEGCLATGFRTSPYLSNLVFLPSDMTIKQAADNLGITYTRYVDDLTFSGKHIGL